VGAYYFLTKEHDEEESITENKKFFVQYKKKDGELISVNIESNSWQNFLKKLKNVVPDFEFDQINITPVQDQSENNEDENNIVEEDIQLNFVSNYKEKPHTDVVLIVLLLPGEEYFVSGSRDNTIKLWSIQNNRCIRTMNGHTKWVTCIDYIHRTKKIITGSKDKCLKIWNLESGQCEQTLIGHKQSIEKVIVYDNGKRAISAGNDSNIILWNLETGQCERTIEAAHHGWITSLSLCGNILVSSANDGKFKIWDLENLDHEINSIKAHGSCINSIYCHSSGYIITGGDDNLVKLWKDRKCIKEFNPHNKLVSCVKFDSEQNYIFSGSYDCTIAISNIKTGETEKVLSGHRDWINDISLFHSNPYILTASSDYTIKLWNVETGQDEKTFGLVNNNL